MKERDWTRQVTLRNGGTEQGIIKWRDRTRHYEIKGPNKALWNKGTDYERQGLHYAIKGYIIKWRDWTRQVTKHCTQTYPPREKTDITDDAHIRSRHDIGRQRVSYEIRRSVRSVYILYANIFVWYAHMQMCVYMYIYMYTYIYADV